MSMATSLEARASFLDKDVVELAFRMPGSLMLRGSTRKYILKKTMADKLPPRILNRFLEYGTLGTIAGLIGALGGQALTFLLSEQVLEIPFRLAVLGNDAAVALAALAVSVVGVTVTLDVLRHKPLSILRVG